MKRRLMGVELVCALLHAPDLPPCPLVRAEEEEAATPSPRQPPERHHEAPMKKRSSQILLSH
jgi:hypothetical protein